MVNYYLCPWSTVFQYFTDSGIILSGGRVYTYLAGTSVPVSTFTDITGSVQNSNPIVLTSNGRLPNVSIWQPGGVAIKIVVTDSVGNQLGPTFDQLQGINDLVLADSALANPASGSGADLVANAVRSYDIFAQARAANVPTLASGQTLIVEFEGGITIADGLSGAFYWNASSTASDDAINVIKPTALSGPGRYLRLNQYIQFYAVKAGTTSRSSTTTVTIDPDLQIAIPTGGTYVLEAWLNDATGTSTGGLKGQFSYSGSLTAGYWGMNGVGTAVTPVSLTAIGATAEFQSAQTGVGNMPVRGMIQCTSAGVLSFQWAQNASNGTASVVSAGSYLRVVRVSSSTGNFSPVTHTYNTPGTATETIPSGASTMTVETWGAGGGGGGGSGTGCGAHGGGGGGSGGYSLTVINVASGNGQTLTYTVGTGGSSGSVGGSSVVSSGTFSLPTMTAAGGNGGQTGGAGTGGTGGTGTGGNTTNTTGNTGSTGGLGDPGGAGGAGLVGLFGTGSTGGAGGNTGVNPGSGGGVGLVVFHYT